MKDILLPTRAALVSRRELTQVDRDAMYGLLSQYFEGVSIRQFNQDLEEKNWAILVWRENRLVGFTTLLAYESVFEGQPVSVIYSGDTIMAPEAWGSSVLARAWIASVNRLRQHFTRGRYYWLLLTSGFRTYRFLPVFWREFFPRFDVPTPPGEKRLIDHLARERFGERYDATHGLVRFKQPQRLRPTLAEVSIGRRADSHVSYFLSRNPDHSQGDELVCLTELAPENLTTAGQRMARSQHEAFGRDC